MSTSRNALIGAMAAAATFLCAETAEASCQRPRLAIYFFGTQSKPDEYVEPMKLSSLTSRCTMKFNASAVTVYTSSVIKKPPAHGTLSRDNMTQFIYQPKEVGDDGFEIEICANTAGREGCSVIKHTTNTASGNTASRSLPVFVPQ